MITAVSHDNILMLSSFSLFQGFQLDFKFDDNEYFTDKVLTKVYEMRSAPDENDPFGFEGPEIVSCKG